MFDQPPDLIFLVFVLPSLFAISLMAEGVWKLSQSRSGWFNIFIGFAFLTASIFGYFILLK
ncbi:MAG: hypothetical protein NUV98_04125 [Candidatus Roizmanbacteria bacterium]|nr:hypothetical protein [Candidatus Roizmanbacteria bacterium]